MAKYTDYLKAKERMKEVFNMLDKIKEDNYKLTCGFIIYDDVEEKRGFHKNLIINEYLSKYMNENFTEILNTVSAKIKNDFLENFEKIELDLNNEINKIKDKINKH